MNLSLVARNVGVRAPSALSGRAYSSRTTASSRSQSGENPTQPPPQPEVSQRIHKETQSRASAKMGSVGTPAQGEWQASLASASEEAVKADRGSYVFKSYQEMQEKTKKVAEEMKDSTESLRDGLWRSVGGGR